MTDVLQNNEGGLFVSYVNFGEDANSFYQCECSFTSKTIARDILAQLLSETIPMFLSRIFRRSLLAAVNSEAAAATTSTITSRNPLEEFFEADRSLDDEKPNVYGRGWKASELRLKSWNDLQKLWYVLLKEKNMLMSQRQMMQAYNLRFPNPERCSKVRKSMCRIKHVLTERALAEPNPRRQVEMKRMINDL